MSSEVVGYIISLILVLFVILQIRGQALNTVNLVRPLVLVGLAAAYYLRSVPSAGDDVTLYAILILVGVLLGLGNGLTTRIYRKTSKQIIAQAGFIAAALWIVGMAARSVFVYYAEHGGASNVASFSEHHKITGAAAWTAALVFMALAQVVVRLAVLRFRGRLIKHHPAISKTEHHEDLDAETDKA